MKICKGHSVGIYGAVSSLMGDMESCYAPIDMNADSSDFCPVPAGLTKENQTTTYGVDCNGRGPVDSCGGISDRNICARSYSRGYNGERPWEYCQFTDAYGCAMMGLVFDTDNSCKWVGTGH